MAKGKFNGMGMGGNMNQMLRQAQKMQADMEKAQAELEERVFEATAGGVVTAAVTGKKLLQSITIDPEVLADAAQDAGMLEDLVLTAVNEALKKADQAAESQLGSIAGGIKIPGLF